jgi:hypothetical protein
MSDPIQIGDGKTHFETIANKWQMGVLETIEAIDKAVASAPEGAANPALDAVIRLVVEAGGPELNRDQAEEFHCKLLELHLLKKKHWESVFNGIAKSPGSTG